MQANRADQREALLSQIEGSKQDKYRQRSQEKEHRERYLLEQTATLTQMQQENRDRQQRYKQDLLQQMQLPVNDEKNKLQRQYEREDSPFNRTHGNINNRVPSTNELKNELLDQISQKQLGNWQDNEVCSLHCMCSS